MPLINFCSYSVPLFCPQSPMARLATMTSPTLQSRWPPDPWLPSPFALAFREGREDAQRRNPGASSAGVAAPARSGPRQGGWFSPNRCPERRERVNMQGARASTNTRERNPAPDHARARTPVPHTREDAHFGGGCSRRGSGPQEERPRAPRRGQ